MIKLESADHCVPKSLLWVMTIPGIPILSFLEKLKKKCEAKWKQDKLLNKFALCNEWLDQLGFITNREIQVYILKDEVMGKIIVGNITAEQSKYLKEQKSKLPSNIRLEIFEVNVS